ncbi:MAG: divalent metal cation transporter [Alphaproteobacteria bacterium]|nr:divalent metal cation transporter [Alphaproteobacteria bacterium]MDE2111969.1 divalent metal cation transporter [Alphaproteobacteria bacterium]MDE2492533.1 divalent metal cation transporter [Alphaproteobacteria bacterium]
MHARTPVTTTEQPIPAAPTPGWRTFLAVVGPGLVVMLADTDVGSIITAAQSGVQWGYRLLLLQILLIPVLYIVQELTVRLAIFTGKGHGELIRDTFGPFWAWVSVAGLGVATVGALLTEFSGIAGVGELYGIPRMVSLALCAAFLILVVLTGTYRRVERAAILLGLFEFAFFLVAYEAHPAGHALVQGLVQMPLADKDYLYLVAANIGAVIMPWMIFYQQSAVADKKLRPEHYRHAKWDTALGAVIAQAIMAAILVAAAATIGKSDAHAGLNTIGDITKALVPILGPDIGRFVFGLGTIGAALVAAIVVSLASAWGFGEIAGYKRSLEYHPSEAPLFYSVYTVAVIGGAVTVGLVPNLVTLNIGVEVMNALMLPIVLGFLVALAFKALPPQHRLRGPYGWMVIGVSLLTAGLGVYGGISGAGLF